MKACVLKGIGNLEFCNIDKPKPKTGEVLLKVKACGICSSDIDRVFKTGTYHFPTIPGHEFAGEVVALGQGVDKSYLGRTAAVFPLLPCFSCSSCSIGEFARCDNYSYFGSRCDGAFAEYIAVPIWNLVLFSEKVSFEKAALCEPSAVGLHAINLSGMKIGDTVAIIGNGTIGLIAAMWAKLYGAGKIIIVGGNKQKLEIAKRNGFNYVVSAVDENPVEYVRELTDHKGVDVAFEFVGSEAAINLALLIPKKGGVVVVGGNPSNSILLEQNNYWKILRNELTLKGIWNSSYNTSKNDWKIVEKFMSSNTFNPEVLITHRFKLSQVEEAFNTLKDKKQKSVKIMFKMD